MSAEDEFDFYKALPKVELHAHLSGSINRETLHEIWTVKMAQKESIDLEDPLTAIKSGEMGFVDINTFFPLFDKYIYALCNDLETVKLATRRVIDNFVADGVRYLELRTTPRQCIATGMSKLDYVRAVGGTILASNASRRDEIEVHLILSIDRGMNAEQADEVVDLAMQHQCHGNSASGFVVGVDLCGNPNKGNVSVFTPAFERAKQAGLGITVHFAEVSNSSTDRELETILSWQPHRLGHCIHVSPHFCEKIVQQNVALELCLSCNVLAGMTTGGFRKHHFKDWLVKKNPVALSTDDMGIFGSPLSAEYRIAAQTSELSKLAVIQLSKSAIDAAFTGHERMNGLMDSFKRYCSANGVVESEDPFG